MEMSTKLKKNQIHHKLDNHDLALECCGYLKTKLFMAKRISDQQLEIDELKDSLFSLTIKYTNLVEFIKNEKNKEKQKYFDNIIEENSNRMLKDENMFQNENPSKTDKIYLDENDDEIDFAKSGNVSIHNNEGILNLSNDCKSIDFDKNNINTTPLENKAEDEKEKENNKNSKFFPEIKELEEGKTDKFERKIKLLVEQNFSLRKINDNLIQELNKTRLELSKVSHEKFSLFSELNEIIESLLKIDLDELNKFYLDSLNINLSRSSIYSAMGIKYNILSASNALGLHAINHSFRLNLGKNENFENKINSASDYEKDEYLGQLFSEKYLQNIRERFHEYDNELNNYVYQVPERNNRNIINSQINKSFNKKNNTYNQNRISSLCFDSEARTDI